MSQRYNHSTGNWTDLESSSKFFHPNIMIKAADVAEQKIVTDSDLFYPGKTRKVIYRQGANEFVMELIPYVHSGATLTLGSLAYDANNVATYTPILQNRMILHTGAQVGAGALVRTIAGVLMADYYTHWDDNSSKRDDHHALTLEAGDFVWLIRRGLCYVDCAAGIADDLGVITASPGEVTGSAAINTGGSNADLFNTMLENTEGLNYAKKVGEARETISGAGQGLIELMLPRDFRVV